MNLYHIAFAFLPSLAAAQEHVSKYTAVQACIVGCPAVDICCISACEGILCPVGLYADRAAHCVSGCPLGTGTPDDAAEYTRCREGCISNNQPPTVTSSSTASTSPSPSATTASSSPASTTQSSTSSSMPGGASSSASTPSSSHGYTETATHTHASPSMTSNAASVTAQANMGGALVGLLGAVLAGI